jgi:hypothetical protein
LGQAAAAGGAGGRREPARRAVVWAGGMSAAVRRGEEVMVTSPTGGRKGRKLAQVSTLDPRSLLVLAEVSGWGAGKYSPHNFLRGYDWSLAFDAALRHLLAFWSGEDDDPESGLPHLGHAAWHCLALLSFGDRELGCDDRFDTP